MYPAHDYYIFFCTFFAFLVFLLDGVTVWANWTVDPWGCHNIIPPHVFFYVLEKQSLYLFLYDRAKIVHDSLSLEESKAKRLHYFRIFLWYSIVLGFAISFYWLPFVITFGVPLSTGQCAYHIVYPFVGIILAVADMFLALGMLAIFVFPLYQHSKEIERLAVPKNRIKSQLDKVIRRNLVFSVIAIIGTFLSLTALCTLIWIAEVDNSPRTDNLRFWGLFCISLESVSSVLALHGMTSGWYPNGLKKFLNKWHYFSTNSNSHHANNINNGLLLVNSHPLHNNVIVTMKQDSGPVEVHQPNSQDHSSSSGKVLPVLRYE